MNKGEHKQIFLNPNGKPFISSGGVYNSFIRACESLGIRRITPHDLRRRFASRIVESGTSLIDARDLLGHTSYKMLETYVNTSISKIKAVQSIAAGRPSSKSKRKKIS
ncbi:MAG: tyrosine-type recombinase/integrase [Thermodesulfobacteriota bacterium]